MTELVFEGKPLRAWIQALKDDNPHVRDSAAYALGQLGCRNQLGWTTKVVVSALLETLRDKARGVAARAAHALGKIGEDPGTVIPHLVEFLEVSPCRSVVEGLALFGPAAQAAAPALCRALKDESVRVDAAYALASIGPAAIPGLREALQDEDENVRMAVVNCALSRMAWLAWLMDDMDSGAREAVPVLVTALKDKDGHIRGIAAGVLSEIGPAARGAVPALIETLKDKVDDTRGSAAEALGAIGPAARAAVPALTQALKDRKSWVRRMAAIALWKVSRSAKESLPILIRVLRDKRNRWLNSYQIPPVLGEMGPKAKVAVPALRSVIHDGYPEGNLLIAEALWRITRSAKESLPVLVRALRGSPPWQYTEHAQERAARILGALGPRAKPAVPALRTALRDKEPEVRMAAAGALWNVTGSARVSVPILIQELVVESPSNRGDYSRSHAAQALGQMGVDAKEAVPYLSRALRDRDGSVRLAAAQALGRLGPQARAAVPALIKARKDDDWHNRLIVAAALKKWTQKPRPGRIAGTGPDHGFASGSGRQRTPFWSDPPVAVG
jgi:HEAT repeat protein